MINKIVFSIAACLVFLTVLAQADNYQKVKVFANHQQLADMAKAGLCVDHGELLPGEFLINVFSEREIEKIKSLNITYEVLIEDMRSYIKERNKNYKKKERKKTCASNTPEYKTPENFKLGSFAGYFTYEEMLANLDSMHAKYPNLITKRMVVNDSIQTNEQRDLYYVRLSDNAEIDEEEPEVFYNALHHAREPLSIQHLIFYMWYLLENYETDEDVKRAVNNVEMYFLPCVNPDGYIYDQILNPEGGGYWRKNRRLNEDGSYGVDLNRNYGFNWGYDDVGSSADIESNTYRGTSPFSEPETQIMKAFCETHNFLIALNCHTSGNFLIYPWGYDYDIYTPDADQYTNYAKEMTKHNNYTFGTISEALYIVNGAADDWMYKETAIKNKILAMTPESGRSGFYPPKEEIISICKDNVWQNLQAANLTLGYITLEDKTPSYLKNKNGYITLGAFRLGMQDEAINIRLQSNDQISSEDVMKVNGLDLLSEQIDSIAYTISEEVSPSSMINYDILVEYEEKTERYTYQKTYMPNGQVIFEDAFENEDQWTGNWQITDIKAFEGVSSYADLSQGQGLYSAETIEYIDLTNARTAVLECRAIWNMRRRYGSYAQISVKKKNSEWMPLCGNYTKAGNKFQDEMEPVYDGFFEYWVLENLLLNDFVGEEIKIQLKTSYSSIRDYEGFYIDNMKVYVQENLNPLAKNDMVNIYYAKQKAIFVLDNDSDPEKDSLSIQITQAPNFGVATVSNDTLIYTINEGFDLENDTLFYKACDMFNGCDEAMVILNIDLEAGVTMPTVLNDTLTISSLESMAISVLDNDIDPVGGILSVEIIEPPTFGSATIFNNNNPSIEYIINENATKEHVDQLSYVACSENGLCDTAQVVFLLDVIIGIDDPLNAIEGIRMYPNPANDVLFIDYLQQAGDLILYNARGQAIKNYSIDTGKAEINTKNFSEGLYYVQFRNKAFVGYVGKLLVVHD